MHDGFFHQMRPLNLALMRYLGAEMRADEIRLWLALVLSNVAVVGIVALLAWAGFTRRMGWRDLVLLLVCAALVGLAAHALAGWLGTPRPFMLGLRPNFGHHGARGGMPSNHAAVMATIAAFLAWRPRLRMAALLTAGLALATGWARIYIGAHFPLDVLGGFVMGAACGSVAALLGRALRRSLPATEIALAR